jgi:hypothetical protein
MTTYATTPGAGALAITGLTPTVSLERYAAATIFAISDGVAISRGADTDANDTTYLQAAQEAARTEITAMTGSGDVLGVAFFNDTVYAFRNNADGTAANMWKATSTGWVACDLGGTLEFTSGGTDTPAVGNTIVGESSGSSAIITRIELDSGTWAGGNAAGTIFYRAKSAAFTASENFLVYDGTSWYLNVFTMTNSETDVTLSPDGSYEFDIANVEGFGATDKLYGADGVNKAFQFDGTAFLQITTGMTTDAPKYVREHKNFLFLAFTEGSLQWSSIGDPFSWSVLTGSTEVAVAGGEITGIERVPGDVLHIATRSRTYLLYGSTTIGGSDPWNLRQHARTVGCLPGSLQRMWSDIFADDRGIMFLANTDQYGDFADGTLSTSIRPLYNQQKSKIVCSTINRSKNQYRLFFNDRSAFFMTFVNQEVIGIMTENFDDQFVCAFSGEGSDGTERIFMGADDGIVYELDSGTNFDGGAIDFYLRANFNHGGNLEIRKHFKRVSLDVDAEGTDITINSQIALGYEDLEEAAAQTMQTTLQGGDAYWNVANWEEFSWSLQGTSRAEMQVSGVADTVTMNIMGTHTYESPHTIFSVLFHYLPRRRYR